MDIYLSFLPDNKNLSKSGGKFGVIGQPSGDNLFVWVRFYLLIISHKNVLLYILSQIVIGLLYEN